MIWNLSIILELFINELFKDVFLSFVIKLCGLENDTTDTLLPDKDLLLLTILLSILSYNLLQYIELYILLLLNVDV